MQFYEMLKLTLADIIFIFDKELKTVQNDF